MLITVLAIGGCGGSKTGSRPNATLELDFTPNAVHAGIYSAVARGFDTREGVHLIVRQPGASTDSVSLLVSGRTDFAILDIHDLAIARERGEDVVGVLALVEEPLAAVEAQPTIRSPRQLAGKTVGVSGLPSDVAVLRSVVAGAGGDPARVHRLTIGFNAVPALLSGRVDAATAFWDVEGIELHARRPATREFRVQDYGAPAYPELVLCVNGATLRRDPGLVASTVAALRRGYAFTLSDPQASIRDELSRVPGLDAATLAAQLHAVLGAFTYGDVPFGSLNARTLAAWARWEVHFGIVSKTPDLGSAFDTRYANSP